MKGVNLTTKMQQPEEPNGMFGGEVVSCGLWASVLSSTSNTDMWVKKKKKKTTLIQTLRIKIELILLSLILRYQRFKERQQGKKLYMAIT